MDDGVGPGGGTGVGHSNGIGGGGGCGGAGVGAGAAAAGVGPVDCAGRRQLALSIDWAESDQPDGLSPGSVPRRLEVVRK